VTCSGCPLVIGRACRWPTPLPLAPSAVPHTPPAAISGPATTITLLVLSDASNVILLANNSYRLRHLAHAIAGSGLCMAPHRPSCSHLFLVSCALPRYNLRSSFMHVSFHLCRMFNFPLLKSIFSLTPPYTAVPHMSSSVAGFVASSAELPTD